MRSSRTLPALLVLLSLAACTAAPTENAAPPRQSERQSEQVRVDVAALAPALSVTDPRGTAITLTKAPERIVCLTGLCDDILVELGIRPVGTSNAALLTHPALLGEGGRRSRWCRAASAPRTWRRSRACARTW